MRQSTRFHTQSSDASDVDIMKDFQTSFNTSVLFLALLPFVLGNGSLDFKDCDLKKCRPCFTTSVTCTTTDKNEVVPQYLNKSMISLNITFLSTNSPVLLRQSEIKRYSQLQQLTISGDFISIERQALDVLPDLRSLQVKETLIAHLPDHLLARNAKLQTITMVGNAFTGIPLNTLDGSTGIPLERFTFSRHNNVLLPCTNGSMHLPIGFEVLWKLTLLDLSYNTFSHSYCSTISDDFFHPVSNISQLYIGGTNIIHTNEFSLTQLSALRTLDISALAPYRFCPSQAETLFFSIPITVQNLDIVDWESNSKIKESCQLTNRSLQGLTRLKRMRKLSFSYGVGIFGPKLLRTTIPKITSLTQIDVTGCQITSVERDTFFSYPQLSVLNLSGNPLGPKDLDILSHSVRTLILSDTKIRSDVSYRYQISHILCQFPNLSAIHFSSNSLEILPEITRNSSSCNFMTFPWLTNFKADNNNVLRFVNGQNQDENICLAFPNLQTLDLSSNNLHSIRGMELCTNLRILHLQNNQLISDQELMARIFHNLTKIVNLNLGFNHLEDLDDDLLIEMPYLEELYLNDNRIHSIMAKLFRNNRKLRRILLANNQIEYVEPTVFDGLSHLQVIDLNNNKLAALDFLLLTTAAELQLQYFGIEYNMFSCSCYRSHLQEWLLDNIQLMNSSLLFITCSSPLHNYGKYVYSYTEDAWLCYIRLRVQIGFFLSALLVTLIGILIPYYRYRWYVRHFRIVWKAFKGSAEMVKKEHLCHYHAYVSFDKKCEEDSIWVVNELIPAIEGCDSPTAESSGCSSDITDQRKIRLYVEPRDAKVGGRRFIEREKALDDSKRILIVVSNSYLRSAECLAEADFSCIQLDGAKFFQPHRILLLIREKLHEENIRPPMSTLLLGTALTVVQTEENRKKEMWKEIRQFLSKPLYMYCKPVVVRGEASDEATNGAAERVTETTPLIS